jgi:hypothetical protein
VHAVQFDRTVADITTAMTLIRAAALGAAAMYLLDPDRGRRRRAIARDKTRSALSQGTQFLSAARSDARARMQGLRAVARRVREGPGAPPDDRVLVARVRARLGRVVSHPHGVHVEAGNGDVRLSGPILKSEHTPLVIAARLVRGVRSVDDRDLVLYDSPDGVPALQGEGRAAGESGPSEWTPAVRLSAIAGGGALALYGLSCSGLARLALSGAGLALVARGSFNVPVGAMLAGAGRAATHRHRLEQATQPDTSDDWSRALQPGEGADGEGRTSQYVQQGGTRQPARASARPGTRPARSSGTYGAQQQAGSGPGRYGARQQAGSAPPASRQMGMGAAGAGMGGSAQAMQGSQARAASAITQEGDLGTTGAGAQYAYPSTARERSQADPSSSPRGASS